MSEDTPIPDDERTPQAEPDGHVKSPQQNPDEAPEDSGADDLDLLGPDIGGEG